VDEIKESILNAYLREDLAAMTPRDIRNLVDSWGGTDADKENLLKWLKDEHSSKRDELSHERLMKTISLAEKYLDSFEDPTEEFRDNMEWLLNMVIPTDQNNETRLINLLDKMGYGYSCELNGYPYLLFFLEELMWYEFIIHTEIKPYKKELQNMIRRTTHNEVDPAMMRRLTYYKDIGERNKHRHAATIHSDKWAIPFEDLAKLYRKILGLSHKALTSPIK